MGTVKESTVRWNTISTFFLISAPVRDIYVQPRGKAVSSVAYTSGCTERHLGSDSNKVVSWTGISNTLFAIYSEVLLQCGATKHAKRCIDTGAGGRVCGSALQGLHCGPAHNVHTWIKRKCSHWHGWTCRPACREKPAECHAIISRTRKLFLGLCTKFLW